jgi:hypothetical protein
METFWTKLNFLPAAALLTGVFSISASAQVICSAQAGATQTERSEGNTELLGDIVLVCTGGTPTAAGSVVPAINITVDVNTNITSKITASFGATNFSEALLLVDEPNQLVQPSALGGQSHQLLNCGQNGAPDNGPSGPAVCSIVSTGVPTQTYDGTPFATGNSVCNSGIIGINFVPGNNYACGRPNAFQGRMATALGSNVVVFDGVPFDPPGPGTRIIRITNLRADAAMLKAGTPINAVVSISGASSTTITFNTGGSTTTPLEVGFTQKGLSVSTPQLLTVRVAEGSPTFFKDRNVANTIANAVFSAGQFVYQSPSAKDPAQAAQNIPGILYNSEDGFQWQNNTTNAPPNPNPPAGFGAPGYIATDSNYPLNSLSFGGINTGINADGVSSAGTRIALIFKTAAASVTVPSVVYLHRVGSPSTTTGVMVLTSTDSAGAGPFTPGASTTIHNGGMAVYEVLYADPFSIEYADIDCVLPGFLSSATVTANMAPFYTTPGAAIAEPPTSPIPRFSTADSSTVTISSSIFGLIFSFF